MTIITTPSGFKAEVLIENAWGPEKKSAGLRYICQAARKRLSALFRNADEHFDLMDIAEDMQVYGFGYADDIPGVDIPSVQAAIRHVFPMTHVSDDLSNCIWHCDKLPLQHSPGVLHRILEPSAVTMLYGKTMDTHRPKQTGFGHPQVIAQAYNEYCGVPVVEDNAASLREFGEELRRGLDSKDEQPEKTEAVRRALRATYEHIDRLFQKHRIVGAHWVPLTQGRMLVFANDTIVHCNDLMKQENSTSRAQALWRRMLPGRPMMGFNAGARH